MESDEASQPLDGGFPAGGGVRRVKPPGDNPVARFPPTVTAPIRPDSRRTRRTGPSPAGSHGSSRIHAGDYDSRAACDVLRATCFTCDVLRGDVLHVLMC